MNPAIMSRGERLAAIAAKVGRTPGSFIPVPATAGHRWFIVKTNPQCELRAVESLLRVGIHAYVPVYRKRIYDDRTKRRMERTTPFMVGYAFVLLPNEDAAFGLVRDCDGVNDFVGKSAERIISIADRDVEVLRRMEATAWLQQDSAFRARPRRFKPGRGAIPERRVIATGVFEGFLATIKAIEGKGTVRVVTQAFGEFEEVVLPVDKILAAA